MTALADRLAALPPEKLALAVREATDRLDAFPAEPVAIIGMGCRFPGGADSPAAFWDLLAGGRSAVTEVPRERWDVDAYYDPRPGTPGKMYTRHGAFLDAVDAFDAELFRISPREAVGMDPQQRLLLETTWTAMDDAAALGPDATSDVGVFVGIMHHDYAQLLAGI
ncbi:MAG TPA: polyketide synthase, partial [Euzebya sp.]|nr:polyketide synthase [Euzebya sp.]